MIPRAGAALGLLALAAIVLPGASSYTLRVLTMAGVFAIVALGYRFIFGLAGALSLAQGTFMGVGAYVSGLLALRAGLPFDQALPFSIGAPVLLALCIAGPVLRLQTHYFALATLLVGRAVLLVAEQWTGLTGGSNGIGGVPGLSVAGYALVRRGDVLAFTAGLVALAAAGAWWFGRGRLGRRYALLRTDPVAARALGIDTGALRLLAFVLSAGFAGLGGSVYVHVLGVVSPDVLGFPVMVTVLTMSVVGGRLSVAGAIAGAVLLTELPEWARGLREDSALAFGVLLLAAVVVLPGGVVPALDRLLARVWTPRPAREPTPIRPKLPSGATLGVMDVSRAFGGVEALRGVSFTLRPGEILGVIGPNGSGKTTLLNVLSGVVAADGGRAVLAGHELLGRPAHRIARAGLARTFQTPVVVPDLTALENVSAVCPAGEAAFWLARLAVPAEARADTLPPGPLRRLEVARALATGPRVLLLDEPAAGLSEADQSDLARVLRSLAQDGLSILVVEHRMGFLLPLVDRLLFLADGTVRAEGPPDAVRADPAVRAHLGLA